MQSDGRRIRMGTLLDSLIVSEIQSLAVDAACGAGQILKNYFGSQIQVDYKGKGQSDPVSVADTESQAYLENRIKDKFSDHGILGEEDKLSKDTPAPDIVWVLDPLDGTRNFVGGLPIYACSVGVLFKGRPVVGAIYIPWPNESGAIIVSGKKGDGSRIGSDSVSVFDADAPSSNLMIGLPSSFRSSYKFVNNRKKGMGEVRVVGSIAYEMAITAMGIYQYSFVASGRLWDVAAGVLIVNEAGGQTLVGVSNSKTEKNSGKGLEWEKLESFFPEFTSGVTTLEDMRSWSMPLLVGGSGVTSSIARSLRKK